MEQPIANWVNEGTSDRVSIKQRIHIILEAIAYDDDLSQVMVLKGGILMSMKFGNDRHTKDVDFSFLEDFSKISDDADSFIEEIRDIR
ncbi:nucleotidyl transferase AbiEii/AbiGii toxin family protein [Acinetobacter baumannii]|uniref:nucleotidyl transferase AbiEii/AbiGii toxin family protein n=1 Tax=Acinetobacter baumannii TaxID=470 RepID=UPI002271D229|nr:nucleotidyl transferase AbiEii/AbiGii toxin family protein [Acinetobacter baumannii]